MARLVAVLVVVLLVTAGCGARSAGKPYTAASTTACLKEQGFSKVTRDPKKIGFIAAFAENGGLQARAADGNVVTMAFAADEAAAKSTRAAFKNRASTFYKKRIADIMQSDRNAVMVWQTTPTQEQIDAAKGCLGS
jgi:hypothetical protein